MSTTFNVSQKHFHFLFIICFTHIFIKKWISFIWKQLTNYWKTFHVFWYFQSEIGFKCFCHTINTGWTYMVNIIRRICSFRCVRGPPAPVPPIKQRYRKRPCKGFVSHNKPDIRTAASLQPTEIKYLRRGMNVFQKVGFDVSRILYARPNVLILDRKVLWALHSR